MSFYCEQDILLLVPWNILESPDGKRDSPVLLDLMISGVYMGFYVFLRVYHGFFMGLLWVYMGFPGLINTTNH